MGKPKSKGRGKPNRTWGRTHLQLGTVWLICRGCRRAVEVPRAGVLGAFARGEMLTCWVCDGRLVRTRLKPGAK